MNQVSRISQNLKILFMGTPEFSVPILEALVHEGYQIISVVTKPDEPAGRKQVLTPPPVKSFIMKHETWNIPILQPEKLKDENFINQVKNLAPDLIVVAAYGKIIPKAILDIPKYGAINAHGSLLPAWRGAAPIQYAILHGDKKTGITIMLIDEEMDHGPLLGKSEILISKSETSESLYRKLSVLGAETLIKIISRYISGDIKPQEQDHSKATFTKIIKKEDGKIDWSKSTLELERMTRAFYPWPTAWTIWNDKVLKILEADGSEKNNEIGKVLVDSGELIIGCGQGSLVIKKLQLESGKILTAREFLNGHKDFIGNILK
ncbi:methionyl-tRNA formyltransferase [Candidatus Azambacteria bacterium RIFCSPHIGHO2_01_FULL_44_55]|uniref:Methionyl-tRNA formyltransferase n=1 Tax=Candidatus Azambacteria bacterium RIFCSPLOWO2_02_FULL_44_14 TaxID=1797306 RepID=A0A1F5CBV4_9BACT|nr:MAG: methionyl-tRNA formyltransferase [Candidatus Azambacteria bacterium RIFCSPLOWO2_01_FULL_44_84]OGD33183.1 MAG: methionyl-tRNA formyltransferase [Candidatus Azambacteria bacterium RIFCSPHIGHO2_02_FULL_45_18]OGD40255.1 MAG: methionyl-tRNA formyltransferase [Candidatus Azambacteria bacterium RIFCSPHIGHO2_01_FULL_44_55]OGD40288.1 MAG: methionyl-tRNA formyltransferase [Candidatus Azambacteria bacterium RIFCSPLOWO2_02_FULL_44_14]